MPPHSFAAGGRQCTLLERKSPVAKSLVDAHVLEATALEQRVSSVVKFKLRWQLQFPIDPDKGFARRRQSAYVVATFSREFELVCGPAVERFFTADAGRDA